MWVELVVGSPLCSERFFFGYSGFPLSSKTNISKLQFDLDYCRALYHEPLRARVIAQALLVFDIKFAFAFSVLHLHVHKQRNSPKSYKTKINYLASLGLALSGFEQPGPGVFKSHSKRVTRLEYSR